MESENPKAVFKDKDLNLFFGFDKEINRSFSILFECDAGLNDNQDEYEFTDLTFDSITYRAFYFCPMSGR